MAGVWDLNQLEDHCCGRKGNYLIPGKVYIDDDYDYNPNGEEVPYIENSYGSPRTSKITFADNPKLKPDVWRPLSQSPPMALVTGSMERNWMAIDIGHGHSNFVSSISTGLANTHGLLTTSCQDEYTRLLDLRQPQTFLNPEGCEVGQECKANALAHPGGIPTMTMTEYQFTIEYANTHSKMDPQYSTSPGEVEFSDDGDSNKDYLD
ncbi:hypothetical protein B0J17DRAFT_721885 [Rhizoctonia solani]|nr:hypothetical protein B0J17DRAFT_721885 [Rhizoctonia solani]